MPIISVLLPVYNTSPEHLTQAIDSILTQSFRDFELLIINDCSTEPHVEQIVQSYADPRIRYMRNKKNLGIAQTRNRLIDEAKGKYLAIMDHDDISLPDRFAKQIAFMEAHPKVGICGTGQKRFGKIFKNNVIRYPEQDADIRAQMFFKCVIHHPSAMIRKSVLDTYDIRYDTSFISGNDRTLYRDISEHAQLHNLPDVLCLYRLHAGMTSRTKRQAIAQEQQRIRQAYLDKMGAQFTPEQLETLNNYATSGRSRIKNLKTLQAVNDVLTALTQANHASTYLPPAQFDKICAQYLVKRCVNAMWHGRINSASILKNTSLPIAKLRIPVALKFFNTIKRGSL